MPSRTASMGQKALRLQRLSVLQLLRIGLLGLGPLTFAACSGHLAQSPNPSQKVVELEKRLLETEKRAIVGELESSRLRRRVHELEEELATFRRETHRPPDIASTRELSSSQGPPPSQGPQRLGQALDEDAVAPAPSEPAIQVEDLEAQMEPSSAPSPQPAAAAGASSGSREAPSSSPPDDQTFAAYDAAYVLFHEQRYQQAEASFEAFVSRYPNSELTDNAQFWIGECRYALGDFAGALEAFSTTVATYPEGNKVPDALLKAGKSLEALGRKDQARQTYLEVQRRFPGTALALAAKERLAVLD